MMNSNAPDDRTAITPNLVAYLDDIELAHWANRYDDATMTRLDTAAAMLELALTYMLAEGVPYDMTRLLMGSIFDNSVDLAADDDALATCTNELNTIHTTLTKD